MYISNTTQEQRRIIDSALDGMYFKVRRAHNLLGRVWDDYAGYFTIGRSCNGILCSAR